MKGYTRNTLKKIHEILLCYHQNLSYLNQTVEVNSSGEFIYTQIVNENENQTQTLKNYVKNLLREKTRDKEEERDYKKFSTLYYKFHPLRVDPLSDEPPGA